MQKMKLVKCLQPVAGGAFKWSNETAVVEKAYLLCKINVYPVGSSGRAWIVQEQEDVDLQYTVYQDF